MTSCIGQIQTLKKDKWDDQVKCLLLKACRHVEPVMKRRNWKVHIVKEFLPKSHNLQGLNENRGETISIRVRQTGIGGESDFHSYEYIVGTLLHELVHIEIGPHNKAFHKVLDEIQTECEQLPVPNDNNLNKNGRSAIGTGHKLSNTTINPINPQEAKRRALASAEKRRQLSSIMMTKPQKLGGSNLNNYQQLTPQEAVRLATLLRTTFNDDCCGTEESTKTPAETPSTKPPAKPPAKWICSECTFENAPNLSKCQICESPKDLVICPNCTFKNTFNQTFCQICQVPLIST